MAKVREGGKEEGWRGRGREKKLQSRKIGGGVRGVSGEWDQRADDLVTLLLSPPSPFLWLSTEKANVKKNAELSSSTLIQKQKKK